MHFALKSLLQEAQNNLKIFKVRAALILRWFQGGAGEGSSDLTDEGVGLGCTSCVLDIPFGVLIPRLVHPSPGTFQFQTCLSLTFF